MDGKSEAYIDGWLAQRHDSKFAALYADGKRPKSDNPYNEFTQERSRIAWHTGYYDRQSAIKHGGDLSLDDVWMDL